MGSPHLLAVSLGPVQRFIAQARRTQDLWTGSWLLAKLASEGARWLTDHDGVELLLPSPQVLDADGDVASMPNRFAVLVPDRHDAAALGRGAEEAIRKSWRTTAATVYDSFSELAPQPEAWRAVWDEQIATHLEVYWAAAPLGDDYRAAWAAVQHALAGRKLLRAFEPREEASGLDTITGEDAALRGTGDLADPRVFWTRTADRFVSRRRWHTAVRGGGSERLGAVSVVKRLHDWATRQRERFPSTSSIAASAWLADGLNRDPGPVEAALRGYGEALTDLGLHPTKGLRQVPALQLPGEFGNWDGDVLYESTLTPDRLTRDYQLEEVPAERLRAARLARRAVVRAVGGEPPTYYAILVFDGDHMGRWVSGDPAYVGERRLDANYHASLSAALLTFAGQARPLIEAGDPSAYGRLVYAGGDDVLALLPAATAPEAADHVAQAFAERFAADGLAVGRSATGSAGVALVHHSYPLDAALTAAREAEHAAKEHFGRDSLALAIVRRSGEHTLAGTPWAFGAHRAATVLQDLAGAFAARQLARGFVQGLASEAAGLDAVPADAWSNRLAWLLRHHALDQATGERLAALLADPLMRWAEALAELPGDEGAVTRLAGWVEAASFLSRGGDER